MYGLAEAGTIGQDLVASSDHWPLGTVVAVEAGIGLVRRDSVNARTYEAGRLGRVGGVEVVPPNSP